MDRFTHIHKHKSRNEKSGSVFVCVFAMCPQQKLYFCPFSSLTPHLRLDLSFLHFSIFFSEQRCQKVCLYVWRIVWLYFVVILVCSFYLNFYFLPVFRKSERDRERNRNFIGSTSRKNRLVWRNWWWFFYKESKHDFTSFSIKYITLQIFSHKRMYKYGKTRLLSPYHFNHKIAVIMKQRLCVRVMGCG